MTYSLNNVRNLFARKPALPPAKKSSFQTAMDSHYAMVNHGTSVIRYLPDMERLIDILSLNRNARAPGLQYLLDHHLSLKKGFTEDDYGNRFLSINCPDEDGGESYPRIAFTSHCDTMSNDPRAIRHPLCYNRDRDVLFRTNGQCLGADDGTGIWLMLNMIDAGVPGLYCFYLDEETGRQGSEWSREHEPIRYSFIDTMISFDRMHEGDIIATQRGDRCCSDEFQQALAELLSSDALKLDFKPGARGSFTDSATFMDDVPECTNVSVGYDKQHTPQETQRVHFVSKLCSTLKLMGHRMHDDLPVVRDPEAERLADMAALASRAPANYAGYGGGWSWDDYGSFDHGYDDADSNVELNMLTTPEERNALLYGDFTDLVHYFPDAIEALIADMGWDENEVAEYVAETLFGLENIRSANTHKTH